MRGVNLKNSIKLAPAGVLALVLAGCSAKHCTGNETFIEVDILTVECNEARKPLERIIKNVKQR